MPKETLRSTAWMKRTLIFISLLLPFLTTADTPDSDEVIYTSVVSLHRNISRQVAILIDSTGDVHSPEDAVRKGFSYCGSAVVNAGVTKKPVWVRLLVNNDGALQYPVLQIANPVLDEIVFYNWKNGKVADSVLISEARPVSERAFRDQNFIFRLKIPPGATDTILLRVKAGEQILLPVQIAELETIENENRQRDLINGLYYGIMLVMFFYNFFLYLTVRDRNYLYYIIYILFVAMTQLTLQGFGYRYFWSELPWLTRISVHVMGAMSGLTTIVFTQRFLNTRFYLRKLNYVLTLVAVMDVLAIVVAVAGFKQLSYRIIDVNAGLGSLIVLLFAIYISYRGNRSARFFLIGWGIFLAAVIVFVMKDFEILPYNNFTRYILLYGSALEVTLLSFALADNINKLKKEKEESQAEALRVARENATIIREQNIVLERKVEERTTELKSTNSELTRTLDDLKAAQSQLVESEKMASLGQLTAGIAHEINNPINFVTSNVNPLKRDVDILIEMMSVMEEISKSDLPVAEKEKRIGKLKEEIDYDYLKTEIGFLLKGISEGSSRTAEIVKGLRIFSRLDEDDLKRADVNEGLDSTLVIMNNQLSKITLEKRYGNLPLVECFPGKLNQVFLNMVSNAIHAIQARFKDMPGGKIVITTSHDDMNLRVSISDNGTGMDEQTKSKLFEPFFTTKQVGEGTGLGLSIAYNTIRKHNGTIHVNSTYGEGTEFTLEIPLVQQLS
jgi:signal transduction histidine kinase